MRSGSLKWANAKGSVLRIFQVSIVVIVILVIFMSTPRVQAWGWSAHRFVSGGAEDIFSDGSFFSNYNLTLHDWCIKPDQGWGVGDWHWLDAISYHPLVTTGGELPWAVENVFDNIVLNLEDENWNTAAQLMGAICHYACDSTVPLHSTYNFNPGGNHGNFEGEVNNHLGEMSIPDYVPQELDNIFDATMATLEESFSFTKEGANPGDNNLTDFLENDILWNDWIKSMTENRLRAGVQFTANIWYTAMIHAGLTIQAPTLIGPEDGEDTIGTPTLTWELVEGTNAYDLQLSTDNGFTSNVITIKDLTATSYIPKDPLANGVWYWRVRSGDNSTNVGLWSGARHFTVWIGYDTPPYEWTPRVSTTDVADGDDVGAWVTLPFEFNFWGEPKTRAYICSNGFLIFDPSEAINWTYGDLNALKERWMIAPFWCDLRTDVAGGIVDDPGVYVDEYADNVVITWEVTSYGNSSDSIKFQAILYSNGDIRINLDNATNFWNFYPTLGISRGDGISYFDITGERETNKSWLFRPIEVGPTPRTHTPIYINGDAGFTLANGVTSGLGTEDDPYIIENWMISARNAIGIQINNTTAYFIIRNFYIYDGWANYNNGIYLYNVRNGKISNNLIENNYCGIDLYYSSNNIIENNLVRNNRWCGIYLYSSSNNIITNSTTSRDGDMGIYLDSSSNNTVENNISKNNNYEGISLWNSDNNLVSSNIVNSCECGIQLFYADNNTIEKNLVKNSCNVGIRLFYSGNNLISNNFVANTYQYCGIQINESSNNIICKNLVGSNMGGIAFWNSNNNRIFHNNFVNNTWQAYDPCSNYWDDGYPSGGNCWSDYTGSDANGDGIGDTQYSTYGGANDLYPLMMNTPPGENVQVNPIPGVSVTFSTVIVGGITTATTSTTGPAPPTGCSRLDIIGVAGQPIYYDITPIAVYSGAVTICICYDETQVAGPEEKLRLMHEVNNLWEDITTSVDTVNNKIYGTTTTLSIFIIVEDVTPVRGKDTAYNVQNTGDAPWVWYAQGDLPPIMATKRVDAGAVVAAGAAPTCRGGISYPAPQRWVNGELDVLLDKMFQWMVPGATKVLWYGDYTQSNSYEYVYNDANCCSWLIADLKENFGYTVNDTIDGVFTPIDDALLASCDILVIPQLQLGDGNVGGDPSLLPDADVQAIKNFVEGGGGLLIMEGSDYAGGNYYKVQNKILRALNMGVYFQSDEIIDDTNYWGDGPWFPIADVDPGSEIGAAYQTATGKTDIHLFSLCSLLNISTINPHGPIYIDGNGNFTIANGVTSGSGTEDDPYIIEKWTISAGSANGIEIRNTTAHFIIRNCYVYDGGSNYCGIYFYNVTNGVVDDTEMENNSSGFFLIDSDNNLIKNCTASKNNSDGIHLENSDNNILNNNTYANNSSGIWLYDSDNNIISNNIVENNNGFAGIFLFISDYSKLRNNVLSNNKYNFFVWGDLISEFYHDVDNSNTVNGKPIYYMIENEDLTFDGSVMDIGYLGLVSCENILVRNLNMSNNGNGILLANTLYSKVTNSTLGNNWQGINLFCNSSNNTIANCTIENNDCAINIRESSNNNTLENNTCSNNPYGIVLYNKSDNNIITNNTCSSNGCYSIWLDSSSNNTISNNIAGNNDNCGIYLYSSENNLIENNIAGNNNYSIYIAYSNNNLILNNLANNNNFSGIHLSDSDNNTISSNTSSNNSNNGIQLSNSNNNLILNNNCSNCWVGISLETSFNNRICHNNFANNAWEQALDYGVNYWDNGYPSGGNYWSNYTGGDYCRGESQDIPVGDGIGDTPYSITGDNNRDRYPLMSPWPLWTGTVTIKRENLYAVTIDLNGDFSAGETLAARFFTYGGTEYQDQTIVCNENIPGHVTLLENVSSPGKDAIQRLELVVVDSGGNVLRTVEIFETSKTIMVARIGRISALWPFANDAQKTLFVTELGSIGALWPFAPTTFDDP